jgi:hypothetical protein
MRATAAKIGGLIDLANVAMELEDLAGLALTDRELAPVQSLEDLIRLVASRLHPVPESEARAAELVARAAQRVAPHLRVVRF